MKLRKKAEKRFPRLRKSWSLKIVLLIVAFILVAGFIMRLDKAHAPTDDQANSTPVSFELKQSTTSELKIFSGQEFADLYDKFAYPNTQLINENSPITGNEAADQRIKSLAVAKGYKLRSAPVTDTFVEVQKDIVLQQRAAQPWLELKAAALADGIYLTLTDGYRSAEDQRTIFLDRLQSTSLDSIAAGRADTTVNKVLETTALPGYSRHHSGYTVDIVCDNDPDVKFEKSSCFTWLSRDNYKNAKSFGWIPSYPKDTLNQGPEPESWEYVWVGKESLVK